LRSCFMWPSLGNQSMVMPMAERGNDLKGLQHPSN
jgi:hypothetical protein